MKKGFTLIELLAVIAILAIIMIIAMPKILCVIEEAQFSSFSTNSKIILKSLMLEIVRDEDFDVSIVNKDNLKASIGIDSENYSQLIFSKVGEEVYGEFIGTNKWLHFGASGTESNFLVEKGYTLYNEVSNGDFVDNYNGWILYGTTAAVSNKVVTLTGNGSFTETQIWYPHFSYEQGSVYFIYVKAAVQNSDATRLRLRTYPSNYYDDVLNPIANQIYELYTKFTYLGSTTDEGRVEVDAIYSTNEMANGKQVKVYGDSGIFAINMTKLGIEDLSEAEMLLMVQGGYFENYKFFPE